MWWAFFLFAVAAKGGLSAGRDAWLQPVLAGPVLLSLLFQGSTPFTEDITLKKYPGASTRLQPWCAALTLTLLLPRVPRSVRRIPEEGVAPHSAASEWHDEVVKL